MIYNLDDLSFQILSVDRFFHKKGVFCVKARPYAALSFRVSGTGSFQFGEKRFTVDSGDLLFIPANVPYQVNYSVSESIVVHLRDCNYYEAETVELKKASEISSLFLHLLEDWKANASHNQAKANLYYILERVNRAMELSMEHTAFATCLQYIEAHFCEQSLDLGAVCQAGFISISGLNRAFRAHFGMSPMQYIIKLRMNKALQLLMDNQFSVKEISYLCGFSDEKYFSRAFKKRYGYPPSQWRIYVIQ